MMTRMLRLNASAQFKRDRQLCKKRGYDMSLLNRIVDSLLIPTKLPDFNRDHGLSGNWNGFRECHILPDWLLIYRVDRDELFLARTGTHSDLF